MAEILQELDMGTSDADGWLVVYKVRREDGEEVTVEAHCTGTADAVARAQENREALGYIADRGREAALRFAESAQSPAQRGNVVVRLSVDPLSGQLRHDYDYEKSL